MALEPLWSALRADRSEADGWLYRRVPGSLPCPTYAALKFPEMRPALLFEVAPADIPRDTVFPASHGFRLESENNALGHEGNFMLSLSSTAAEHDALFCLLSEDVIDVLVGVGRHEAMEKLQERLRLWQEFARRHADGLSHEAQEGLFAELTCLLHLFEAMDHGHAVSAWVGGMRALHDFSLVRAELEVKASFDGSAFTVSSLDQLASGGSGSLLVAHYTLRNDPAGRSIVDLVSTVRGRLIDAKSETRRTFEDRLLHYGYAAHHVTKYASEAWLIAAERVFLVSEGFPRLTRASIPAGIRDASYRVDLAACRQYELGWDELVMILQGGYD